MDTVTFKFHHAESSTTRKLVFKRESVPDYASLVRAVLDLFQLQGSVQLVYQDEDGDAMTLSSDYEIQELAEWDSTIRFELKTSAHPERKQPGGSIAEISPRSIAGDAQAPSVGKSGAEGLATQEDMPSIQPVEATEPAEPTTPTLLFADPDDSPLPSTADSAQGQPSQHDVHSQASTKSSAYPGAFPDDPLDIPLPSSSDDNLPFSNLSNTLSAFLASLGTRSSTLSSHVASALDPNSPHSPTARLSTILSASSLDNIPLVASSLVQMGTEFAEIAKDVAVGVRREAAEIRDEFDRLRLEVEREKVRFRDEVRQAMEQAGQATEPDPSTPTGRSTSTPVPEVSSSSSSSSRSSVSPSTTSRATAEAEPKSSPTVSAETARLLHKQAKQARKQYRAAVRQAREERKRARTEATTGSQSERSTSNTELPGALPQES
ncbi:uncharacterized protein JCM15063_002911 [Sporobolomyces koalae]|uniref:uncharacterized protein n=1 Tax=Sporobolomyces koalae TaxID=500713 RepID=UPI0031713AB6